MSYVEQLEAAGEVLSPAVRAALVALEARVAALEAEKQQLLRLIARLEARVQELEARLAQNSTNSSRPPSADPPGTRRPPKGRSGKKRGGQPGHPGAFRSLLPPECVDHVVEHRPTCCRRCGAELANAPEVGVAGRHQVIELPRLRAEVSEHRTLTLACPSCGQWTRARVPQELARSHFGPRLVAFGAVLLARFRLSRRSLQELFSDLLDVPAPALGTSQRFADEAARALLASYREVRRALRRSSTAAVDESGWKLRVERRSLWAAASRSATLYRIACSRAARERHKLLGTHFAGVISTDRWRAYDDHPRERRQLCWAHLKRNFQALADAGGPAAALGRWGVAESERLFGLWKRRARDELSPEELERSMRPLMARLGRLLRRGESSPDRRARALSRDLLRLWPALWTFVGHSGLEPTNNAAERALRKGVLWRKNSFGSASGRGLRFAERMLTASETCRQQQRNLLDYLTHAIDAQRHGQPIPRLLAAG